MQKLLAVSVLAFAAAAGPSLADDGPRLNVPRAQWLSSAEIVDKLAAQGLKVHEIEADDGAYEFEATNAAGVRIEGHAHPATGDILTGYDD